jgi:hypothetical protein
VRLGPSLLGQLARLLAVVCQEADLIGIEAVIFERFDCPAGIVRVVEDPDYHLTTGRAHRGVTSMVSLRRHLASDAGSVRKHAACRASQPSNHSLPTDPLAAAMAGGKVSL